MSELLKYKKLVQEHPARQYMTELLDVNHRGHTTSVAMEFNFSQDSLFPELRVLSGVSILAPTDTPDNKTGLVVAMYNCLQRAKAYMPI